MKKVKYDVLNAESEAGQLYFTCDMLGCFIVYEIYLRVTKAAGSSLKANRTIAVELFKCNCPVLQTKLTDDHKN